LNRYNWAAWAGDEDVIACLAGLGGAVDARNAGRVVCSFA
jgi:hypothetical protein